MGSMYEQMNLTQVLDDLQTRFIINIPDEELSSVERICFQIEQAHWYYEDFVREHNPSLPSYSLKTFTALFFRHCPLLDSWAHDHEKAFDNFMQYKVRVPVCGAIVLNEKLDKALLVRGWKANANWSFPRGKINKEEKEIDCAVREVIEETGFDITPYLRENDYVEMLMKEQRIRLYIVHGVSEETNFETKTRKEIGAIQWFTLTDLPGWRQRHEEKSPKKQRFYMVTVFIGSLKKWIAKYKKQKKSSKKQRKGITVTSGYRSGTDADSDTDVPTINSLSMMGLPPYPMISSSDHGLMPSMSSDQMVPVGTSALGLSPHQDLGHPAETPPPAPHIGHPGHPFPMMHYPAAGGAIVPSPHPSQNGNHAFATSPYMGPEPHFPATPHHTLQHNGHLGATMFQPPFPPHPHPSASSFSQHPFPPRVPSPLRPLETPSRASSTVTTDQFGAYKTDLLDILTGGQPESTRSEMGDDISHKSSFGTTVTLISNHHSSSIAAISKTSGQLFAPTSVHSHGNHGGSFGIGQSHQKFFIPPPPPHFPTTSNISSNARSSTATNRDNKHDLTALFFNNKNGSDNNKDDIVFNNHRTSLMDILTHGNNIPSSSSITTTEPKSWIQPPPPPAYHPDLLLKGPVVVSSSEVSYNDYKHSKSQKGLAVTKESHHHTSNSSATLKTKIDINASVSSNTKLNSTVPNEYRIYQSHSVHSKDNSAAFDNVNSGASTAVGVNNKMKKKREKRSHLNITTPPSHYVDQLVSGHDSEGEQDEHMKSVYRKGIQSAHIQSSSVRQLRDEEQLQSNSSRQFKKMSRSATFHSSDTQSGVDSLILLGSSRKSFSSGTDRKLSSGGDGDYDESLNEDVEDEDMSSLSSAPIERKSGPQRGSLSRNLLKKDKPSATSSRQKQSSRHHQKQDSVGPEGTSTPRTVSKILKRGEMTTSPAKETVLSPLLSFEFDLSKIMKAYDMN